MTTGYDPLGRPTSKWQGFIGFDGAGNATTWQPYNLSRTYNLAGGVTSETYPSGRTVSYGYDAAGRLQNFTGNLGGGSAVSYATDRQYNARGQMIREQFGTTQALYQRKHYNRRGQLFDIRLGTDGSAAYDVENPTAWK